MCDGRLQAITILRCGGFFEGKEGGAQTFGKESRRGQQSGEGIKMVVAFGNGCGQQDIGDFQIVGIFVQEFEETSDTDLLENFRLGEIFQARWDRGRS